MKQDVLAFHGPTLKQRQELYDFIVEEIRAREELLPHRLRPVRVLLERHRDSLLAFAAVLENIFEVAAAHFSLPVELIQQVHQLQGIAQGSVAHSNAWARLVEQLGPKLVVVESFLRHATAHVHRASSAVENLNSRLRTYFFLRRSAHQSALVLLRFFLNHRRYPRSESEQRVGKSPAEVLSGAEHPHWLEMLGFMRLQH